MTVELYSHQRKAVEELSNGKILYGGVGTGKTITSLVYFYEKVCGGTLGLPQTMTTPKDLYIFTTARKRDDMDWQTDAAMLGLGRERESSPHGIKVTVDSWQNIRKYQDVKDAFIIFDEQRLSGTGVWVKSFLKMARVNEWVLLTATPGDTWLDYIPVFIANGFVKNRTQFKRDHVVYSTYTKYPKVERYLGVGKLVKWRNSILVHMPYKRHTTRHLYDIFVDYDAKTYETVVKKRWNVFEEQPVLNVSELFSVMRRVVNSHPSRLDEIQKLMEKHPKLIVFYNFDYELEMLRELGTDLSQTELCGFHFKGKLCKDPLPCGSHEGLSPGITESRSGFAFAEWNGHKHEPIPTTDSWLYLVQYQAGAEAWNCIETDAIAFYSQTYSYKQFEQCQGRIDRLNTPFLDLNYYILKSRAPLDLAISKALVNKEDFNESAYRGKYAA